MGCGQNALHTTGRSPGSRVVGFGAPSQKRCVSSGCRLTGLPHPSPLYSRGVGCDKDARIGSVRRIPFWYRRDSSRQNLLCRSTLGFHQCGVNQSTYKGAYAALSLFVEPNRQWYRRCEQLEATAISSIQLSKPMQ